MMRPPGFIECCFCSRVFGSKSIVIHEPQCQKKLRQSEALEQQLQESSSGKRRKKKRNNQQQNVQKRLEGGADYVPIENRDQNQKSREQERIILPKILRQSDKMTQRLRPTTATLSKPKILNIQYIKYDMSLKKIDSMDLQSKSSKRDSNSPPLEDLILPALADLSVESSASADHKSNGASHGKKNFDGKLPQANGNSPAQVPVQAISPSLNSPINTHLGEILRITPTSTSTGFNTIQAQASEPFQFPNSNTCTVQNSSSQAATCHNHNLNVVENHDHDTTLISLFKKSSNPNPKPCKVPEETDINQNPNKNPSNPDPDDPDQYDTDSNSSKINVQIKTKPRISSSSKTRASSKLVQLGQNDHDYSLISRSRSKSRTNINISQSTLSSTSSSSSIDESSIITLTEVESKSNSGHSGDENNDSYTSTSSTTTTTTTTTSTRSSASSISNQNYEKIIVRTQSLPADIHKSKDFEDIEALKNARNFGGDKSAQKEFTLVNFFVENQCNGDDYDQQHPQQRGYAWKSGENDEIKFITNNNANPDPELTTDSENRDNFDGESEKESQEHGLVLLGNTNEDPIEDLVLKESQCFSVSVSNGQFAHVDPGITPVNSVTTFTHETSPIYSRIYDPVPFASIISNTDTSTAQFLYDADETEIIWNDYNTRTEQIGIGEFKSIRKGNLNNQKYMNKNRNIDESSTDDNNEDSSAEYSPFLIRRLSSRTICEKRYSQTQVSFRRKTKVNNSSSKCNDNEQMPLKLKDTLDVHDNVPVKSISNSNVLPLEAQKMIPHPLTIIEYKKWLFEELMSIDPNLKLDQIQKIDQEQEQEMAQMTSVTVQDVQVQDEFHDSVQIWEGQNIQNEMPPGDGTQQIDQYSTTACDVRTGFRDPSEAVDEIVTSLALLDRLKEERKVKMLKKLKDASMSRNSLHPTDLIEIDQDVQKFRKMCSDQNDMLIRPYSYPGEKKVRNYTRKKGLKVNDIITAAELIKASNKIAHDKKKATLNHQENVKNPSKKGQVSLNNRIPYEIYTSKETQTSPKITKKYGLQKQPKVAFKLDEKPNVCKRRPFTAPPAPTTTTKVRQHTPVTTVASSGNKRTLNATATPETKTKLEVRSTGNGNEDMLMKQQQHVSNNNGKKILQNPNRNSYYGIISTTSTKSHVVKPTNLKDQNLQQQKVVKHQEKMVTKYNNDHGKKEFVIHMKKPHNENKKVVKVPASVEADDGEKMTTKSVDVNIVVKRSSVSAGEEMDNDLNDDLKSDDYVSKVVKTFYSNKNFDLNDANSQTNCSLQLPTIKNKPKSPLALAKDKSKDHTGHTGHDPEPSPRKFLICTYCGQNLSAKEYHGHESNCKNVRHFEDPPDPHRVKCHRISIVKMLCSLCKDASQSHFQVDDIQKIVRYCKNCKIKPNHQHHQLNSLLSCGTSGTRSKLSMKQQVPFKPREKTILTEELNYILQSIYQHKDKGTSTTNATTTGPYDLNIDELFKVLFPVKKAKNCTINKHNHKSTTASTSTTTRPTLKTPDLRNYTR